MSFDWGTAAEMALVLMAWSLLYRDNVFYRVAENLTIGWFMAMSLVIGLGLLRTRVYNPLFIEGRWLSPLIIVTILGLFYLLRLYRETRWLARWPISLMAGVASAVAVKGVIYAQIIRLVTMKSWAVGGLETINNIIIAVFTFTGLSYFIFTKEHRGVLGYLAGFGRYALMICFGWTAGTYLMSLISMSVGHMQTLMQVPGIYVSAVAVIILIIGIIYDTKVKPKI
ncbi:hypothetical protein KEJ34_08460 [Candidatus Bathyarchaeota archaeon]|nr:hypothetical protein [Candidatus Bathyarchaeota archaeon]